ncbi:hypothetical protein K443DRAFT_469680, partial [Laccaria amethystina LaAM-08-1]
TVEFKREPCSTTNIQAAPRPKHLFELTVLYILPKLLSWIPSPPSPSSSPPSLAPAISQPTPMTVAAGTTRTVSLLESSSPFTMGDNDSCMFIAVFLLLI